jgi:hypothetical protein
MLLSRLASNHDPPTYASHVAEITGMRHDAWLSLKVPWPGLLVWLGIFSHLHGQLSPRIG